MPRIRKRRRRYAVVRVTLGGLRLQAAAVVRAVAEAAPYSAPMPYSAPVKYGG